MSVDYAGQSQGPFAAPPRGVVLHGSRGGAASRQQEFLGTCRWAASNPAGLAWHATIGDGVYARHLPAGEWGWHAREASRTYLGVEFVQPTINDAITDAQVAAFVSWYQAVVLPVWPHLGPGPVMPCHSELPSGKRDGKTDVYPAGDPRNDDLRARLYMALTPATDPADAAMEATYQAHAGAVGAKRFAGEVDRPSGQGRVLVCDGGIIRGDGGVLATGLGAVDDLTTYWDAHGVLVRY